MILSPTGSMGSQASSETTSNPWCCPWGRDGLGQKPTQIPFHSHFSHLVSLRAKSLGRVNDWVPAQTPTAWSQGFLFHSAQTQEEACFPVHKSSLSKALRSSLQTAASSLRSSNEQNSFQGVSLHCVWKASFSLPPTPTQSIPSLNKRRVPVC